MSIVHTDVMVATEMDPGGECLCTPSSSPSLISWGWDLFAFAWPTQEMNKIQPSLSLVSCTVIYGNIQCRWYQFGVATNEDRQGGN